MSGFGYQVIATDTNSRARCGIITTPHGIIETPAFVPVGTQATVKSLTPDELNTLGVQLFFVNTYHAYLRPGLDVIGKFGGLHGFMNWHKPIITDSGGFQVFSLGGKTLVNVAISEAAVLDRERFAKRASRVQAANRHVYPDEYKPVGELVAIDDDGVTFTSHWDGTKHRFTPERSLEIQHVLGSDIMIAFDECAPYPTTHEYATKAMERTHRWARRSLEAHAQLNTKPVLHGKKADVICDSKPTTNYHALYGVVQGSIYEDLRTKSAKVIAGMNVDGIAIGGVSVGESKREMADVLRWVTPHLPDEKPRHLLGVGEIDDIFVLVQQGMDTFDCVQPTRLARMGRVYTRNKKSDMRSPPDHSIDITKSAFALDTMPIEAGCTCFSCTHFSRAYIHHLFRVRELLGYRLATIHNIHFIQTLVSTIRLAIENHSLLELEKDWLYNM